MRRLCLRGVASFVFERVINMASVNKKLWPKVRVQLMSPRASP